MFRTSIPARRSRRNGFVSNFALTLALAGGLAIGVTTVATPALAAKKSKDEPKAEAGPKPTYTKPFVDAYKPLEDAEKAAQDAAAMQPGLPLIQPMLDKISNDDERNVAGQMVVRVGLKVNDKKLQRQGLILELDSGKVPDNLKAQYSYYVGGISWENKDYDLAQKYLGQAFDLGYTGDDIESLLASTYFERDQYDAGLAELRRMEQVREAAGSVLPELALRSGLQAAYDQQKTDQVADWAALAVEHYPSPDLWNIALTMVGNSFDFSGDESLDLFRLMKLTNSMKQAREYVDYIAAADPRKMSNEVLPLIQDGISKGVLDRNDVLVKENLQIATDRAPKDKAEAEEIAADARTAANGIAARAAGDNYLSLGQPDKAAEMFQLATQKGGVEVDRLQMRTAVAFALAGNDSAARENFAQVTGKRAPIAKMWLAYLDSKNAAAAAPATAAAPAGGAAPTQ